MATVTEKRVTENDHRPPGYWGKKVLRYSRPRRISYRQMAAICGVVPSTFGDWMAGISTVPSSAVESLADHFGVPTDELRTTPRPRRLASRVAAVEGEATK
jgi:hypothetical protein